MRKASFSSFLLSSRIFFLLFGLMLFGIAIYHSERPAPLKFAEQVCLDVPSPPDPVHEVSTFCRGMIEGVEAAWHVRYDISQNRDDCLLILKIYFIPGPEATFSEDAAVKDIETQWNNKVILRRFDEIAGEMYDVRCTIKIVPVHDLNQAHAMVFLNPGKGRSRVHEWFLEGMKPAVPAHEVGHMIGLYDEYPNGARPTKSFTSYDGLMGYGTLNDMAKMHKSYYEPWLNFVGHGELVYVVPASEQASKKEDERRPTPVMATPTQTPQPQRGWPEQQGRGLFRRR